MGVSSVTVANEEEGELVNTAVAIATAPPNLANDSLRETAVLVATLLSLIEKAAMGTKTARKHSRRNMRDEYMKK